MWQKNKHWLDVDVRFKPYTLVKHWILGPNMLWLESHTRKSKSKTLPFKCFESAGLGSDPAVWPSAGDCPSADPSCLPVRDRVTTCCFCHRRHRRLLFVLFLCTYICAKTHMYMQIFSQYAYLLRMYLWFMRLYNRINCIQAAYAQIHSQSSLF